MPGTGNIAAAHTPRFATANLVEYTGFHHSIIAITTSDDHAKFMKMNCAESCGFCEQGTEVSEEEGQTDDCADNSEHAATVLVGKT